MKNNNKRGLPKKWWNSFYHPVTGFHASYVNKKIGNLSKEQQEKKPLFG